MGGFEYEAECPHCGAVFEVPRIRLSGEEPCPVCRGLVRLPDAAAVEGAGEAEPAAEEEAPVGALEQDSSAGLRDEEQAVPEAAVADESAPAVVCCAVEAKPNPLVAGEIVARYTGLTAADARQQVVRGMGFLAERLTVGAGRSMVAELRGRGIVAFVMPAAQVPRVSGKVPLVCVYGADEAALHLQTDTRGTISAVPWDRLAAGVCTQPASAPAESMELVTEDEYIPGEGLLTYSVRRMTRPEPGAGIQVSLVFAEQPAKVRLLTFGERQVRYAYLQERARPSHEQNLSLFLSDVLNWGGHAFFSAGFRAAARGEWARVPRAVSKSHSDNLVRWAICCAAARGLFGSR
jgi:hypothetical protein